MPLKRAKLTRHLWLYPGVWLVVVLGSFVVRPVLDRYTGGLATTALVRIALAIAAAAATAGIAALPANLGKAFWFSAGPACLLGSLICGWAYTNNLPDRTAAFEEVRIAIGEPKTDEATKKKIDRCCEFPGPTPDCRSADGLLWCASGNPEEFYTSESIRMNFRRMSILYISTTTLITAGLAACGRLLLPGSRARQTPVRVFISYSRRDEPHCIELAGQLRNFQRIGFLESWYDGAIKPGEDWEKQIEANLGSADVVLLLVSSEFLLSRYCALEWTRALERQKAGQLIVVPIIVGQCEWQSAPFARLQVVPRNSRPLSDWPDRKAAWSHIMDDLVGILEQPKV